MRFSGIAAASLVAPLVAAHGGLPGAPKIFGLGANPIAQLKSRNVFHGHAEAAPQQGPQLHARQGGVDGQCGPAANGASCDAGFCCSGSGWCGVGNEYCQAPDCLFNYGPGCDANQVPGGSDTSTVARTLLGAVPYGGEGIYSCTVPGTVAITYDDGPYIYTDQLLDLYASYNAKATFFVTGINIGKGAIDNSATAWPAVIRRMYNEGHQVASHTWSHQDLSAITSQQRKDQMVRNEMAIRNIIGKFPTYMRPPYSSCTAASGCQADMETLGYVVSYFDLDTDDYNNVTPELIQNAKNNVANAVQPSNSATTDFLAIAHDIHQQTAQNLTVTMLDLFTAKNYRIVTMGECMGEPIANWYRDSSGSLGTYTSATPTATATTSLSTGPPTASPTAVSPDGSCGGSTGYTCNGFSAGSCCSQYGWCGSETNYCTTGCQSLFGTCNGDSLPSSLATTSAPASSSSASATVSLAVPTATPTGATTTDGSCGGTAGFSCIGFGEGSCCSQYGWCGTGENYCGTGCNPLFGLCGSSVSVSSSVASSATESQSSTVAPSSSLLSSSSSVVSSSSSVTSSSSSLAVPSTTKTSTAVTSTATRSSTSTRAASSTSTSTRAASSTSTSTRAASSTSTSTRAASSTTTKTSAVTSTLTTATRSSTSTKAASSTSAAIPAATQTVSKDGSCGGTKQYTCNGYNNQQCCRFDGKCSNNILGCGVGCQKKYGTCWW